MRELKFRAWVDNSEMHTVESIHFDENEYIKTVKFWEAILWDEENWWYWWERNMDNCILMQYTWIKDKNWTDVYEWDIVEWYFSQRKKRLEVKFNEDILSYCVWSKHLVDMSLVPEPKNQLDYGFEIIGNLYENPELLTSK